MNNFLSRREFVRSGAIAGAAIGLSASMPWAADTVAGKSEVFIGKGTADSTIPKILEKMGGIARFVKPGSRVVIKPNMSFSNPPQWGTTTSPLAVATIAKMCIDAGAKRVIVCDNTLHDAELCKQKTGIAEAVKLLKGVVVFTPKQDSMFQEVTSDKAKQLIKTQIVKEVLTADCLISLPTAKSHSAGGVSLGIKGLMGLVKERGLFHSELDLHRAVAEQLYYMKPTFTIIDASRALLDNGPSGPGKVIALDTFIGGTDPVAVDSYGVTVASWYGRKFEGKQVAHIKWAGELGFGNLDASMISEIAV